MSDERNEPGDEEAPDYNPDLLTLEDEDGNEHTFEVIDAADFKDQRYLAVVPYSEDPEAQLQQDGQLIIMRVDEDEEGEYLDIVDDDEELVDVSKMFETRLREIFDIDDSDL